MAKPMATAMTVSSMCWMSLGWKSRLQFWVNQPQQKARSWPRRSCRRRSWG